MSRSSSSQRTATPVTDLPEGAKRVSRTTREEFMEKLDGKDGGPGETADRTADAPADLEDLPTVDDDPIEEESLSPVQKFLFSLRDRGADGGIRIYAVRKPDPVGMTFKNPCNTEFTAGDVPYDESDLSIEALEVSIQKLYGGGRYQIKVRQNGDYAGAITRNIRDLPEEARRNEHSETQQVNHLPPQQVGPPRSAKDELLDTLDLFDRIVGVRTQEQQRSNPVQPIQPPAPPASPVDTARDVFSMVKEARGIFGEPASSGGGKTNMVDSIANLIDKLRIGDLIVEGGKLALPILLTAKANAEAKGPNGKTAEPVPTQHALPPQPTEPPIQSPSDSAQPTPGDLEEMEVLAFIVGQMRAYEADETNERIADYVAPAAARVKALPAQRVAGIAFMPSAFLLSAIAGAKPEWQDVANLRCGSEFIDELKDVVLGQPESDEPEEGAPLAAESTH